MATVRVNVQPALLKWVKLVSGDALSQTWLDKWLAE